MQKIIDGKLYDTETAERICDVSLSTDPREDDCDLYRSPKGQFFIAGESGPTGRFALRIGNTRRADSGMELVSEEQARAYVEQKCPAETFVRLFGKVEEG